MKKNIYRALSLTAAMTMTAAMYTGCGKAEDGGNYTSHRSESYISEERYDTAPSDDFEECPFYGEYNTEEYKNVIEAGFKDPEAEPLSTFSADVDTASYSNARRFLEDNRTVPEDAVRIEEFINYFDYSYESPEEGEKFSRYAELMDCPWDASHKLMMLGIQGERLEKNELPPSNLVFLIDSSGSMDSYNKLPLVQNAMSMLTEKLTKDDRVSIVTYSGESKVVLESARGDEKDKINKAIYSLRAEGCTNGEGGINDAYDVALNCFIEGGNNRIIMATDGDLNVGISSEEDLIELIQEKRDRGIYLSVLGVGTGNYKDNKLEALADNGNGNYSYIDSVDEARRVLVEEMAGTLFTIAKDVKIQVEFNPAQVKRYRLIGYDNRIMDAEDFYDDSKDAGEVGAGHSVTALYEIELVGDGGTYHGIPLEFAEDHAEPLSEKAEKAEKTENEGGRTELCKFSVAYKDIDTGEEIYGSDLYGMERYSAEPTQRIRLAGAAAEFAMLLKNSEYKGDSTFDSLYKKVCKLDGDGDRIDEFKELVQTAMGIYDHREY